MCDRETKGQQQVEVEVESLAVDPSSNQPIILLRERGSDRFLPIWIGLFEAQAIAMVLEGVSSSRPMTHDLLHETVARLDARVVGVEICDLQDETFFARINLEISAVSSLSLDARPSDAIALALRADAPIRVQPDVFSEAATGSLFERIESDSDLRKWLEEADPDAFGDYEM